MQKKKERHSEMVKIFDERAEKKEELIKRLKIYEDNDFIRSLLIASKRIQELQSRQEELEQHLEEYKSKMDELKQFGLIK